MIPFLVAYVLYRATIDPAMGRGEVVRASIDLHRLEVYEKLGLREPTSFSDERGLATKLGQLLLYGKPYLPDDCWRVKPAEAKSDGSEARDSDDEPQVLVVLEELLRRWPS